MDILERNNGTGLTESTHSSSSSGSAEKYALDESDERPILLYKYRGGLQTSSQRDLCAWLDKGESPMSVLRPWRWACSSSCHGWWTKRARSHDSDSFNTPPTHLPDVTTC